MMKEIQVRLDWDNKRNVPALIFYFTNQDAYKEIQNPERDKAAIQMRMVCMGIR